MGKITLRNILRKSKQKIISVPEPPETDLMTNSFCHKHEVPHNSYASVTMYPNTPAHYLAPYHTNAITTQAGINYYPISYTYTHTEIPLDIEDLPCTLCQSRVFTFYNQKSEVSNEFLMTCADCGRIKCYNTKIKVVGDLN